MVNIENLIRRRSKAIAVMQVWRPLLDKAYRYAAPNRNMWRDNGDVGIQHQTGGTPATGTGTNLTSELYDLTLLIGTRTFVNRLVNSLIPQNQHWIKFLPGDQVPEDQHDEAAELMQKLNELFFHYLDNSNFYLAAPEAFEDMAISTGVLQVNEGDDSEPLIFSSVPSNTISFESGVDGSFKGYFRDFADISSDEVKQYWPGAKVPSQYTQEYTDKKMHIVESTIYNYETKVWDTTVFELSCKEVVYESEEDESPFIGFRWSKRSSEILGRGPALDSVSAAASINEAMKDELIAAAFRANPMYLAFSDQIINLNNFKIRPGNILACLPNHSGQLPIMPIPDAGNVQFGMLVVQDLRQQIETLMFSSPLGAVDLPKQTATEAAIRLQQLNENAAASFSRIKREFFDPLVKRCISILHKRGMWPNLLPNGQEIAVKYETPLTTSRGQAEAQKLVLMHQALSGMVGPELAAGAMNLAKLPYFLAKSLEVDLELVKSEKVISQELQQAQQAQQQAIDQQQGDAANGQGNNFI